MLDQMENVWNKGLLKYGENGEIVPVDDPAERAHLANSIKKEKDDAA